MGDWRASTGSSGLEGTDSEKDRQGQLAWVKGCIVVGGWEAEHEGAGVGPFGLGKSQGDGGWGRMEKGWRKGRDPGWGHTRGEGIGLNPSVPGPLLLRS